MKDLTPFGSLDIPALLITANNAGDNEKDRQFVIQSGVLLSTLEHATPEQLFNTDPANPPNAFSAVKALQIASAEGQRIYNITQANINSVMPNLNLDAATEAEIQAAVNVGKEVITHTDLVSVPGYTGAGYIILDPVTGAGAYKISGGGNGSFLKKIAKALRTVATGFPLTKIVVLMIDIAFTISSIIDVISKCGLSLQIFVGLTVLTALSAGIGALLLSPVTLVGSLYGGAGLVSLSALLGVQYMASLWLDKIKGTCR